MKDPTSIVGGHIPRRWTLAPERRRWAEAWERSGKTHTEFAQLHGFSTSTLRRWIRERTGPNRKPPRPVALQEISLGELLGNQGNQGGRAWEAEIRLPSGVVIAVAPGTTRTRVRDLVEAVRC